MQFMVVTIFKSVKEVRQTSSRQYFFFLAIQLDLLWKTSEQMTWPWCCQTTRYYSMQKRHVLLYHVLNNEWDVYLFIFDGIVLTKQTFLLNSIVGSISHFDLYVHQGLTIRHSIMY